MCRNAGICRERLVGIFCPKSDYEMTMMETLFGNYIAFFSRKFISMRKMCNEIFWTFFPKFTTKIYCFETNKICNVIFWIGNDGEIVLPKFIILGSVQPI